MTGLDIETEYRTTLLQIARLLSREHVRGIMFVKKFNAQDEERIVDDPLKLMKVLDERDDISIGNLSVLKSLLRQTLPRRTYLDAKERIKSFQKKYRQENPSSYESIDEGSPPVTLEGPELLKLQQFAAGRQNGDSGDAVDGLHQLGEHGRRATADVLPQMNDVGAIVILSRDNLSTNGLTTIRFETTPVGSSENVIPGSSSVQRRAGSENSALRRRRFSRQECVGEPQFPERGVSEGKGKMNLLTVVTSCLGYRRRRSDTRTGNVAPD